MHLSNHMHLAIYRAGAPMTSTSMKVVQRAAPRRSLRFAADAFLFSSVWAAAPASISGSANDMLLASQVRAVRAGGAGRSGLAGERDQSTDCKC